MRPSRAAAGGAAPKQSPGGSGGSSFLPKPGSVESIEPSNEENQELIFKRCERNESSTQLGKTTQLGKSTRHPITGEVSMEGVEDFPDFTIVDLWTRDKVSGTVQKLASDPYLFRPVPMMYRTWMYHDDYRSRLTSFERGENSMLRQALDHECIDAPVSAGRWSPMMCFVPLAGCMSLTGDNVMIALPLIVVALLHVLSQAMNSAKWYKLLRPFTLLPRIAFFLFLVFELVVNSDSLNATAVLGFSLSLLISSFDFIAGDGAMLFGFRLICSYEISQVLPNRLFICTRQGACQLEHLFGNDGGVSEYISGFSPWLNEHTLIADIQGIIVELRPLRLPDWEGIFKQVRSQKKKQELHVLGLDVFDKDNPSVRAMVDKPSSAFSLP